MMEKEYAHRDYRGRRRLVLGAMGICLGVLVWRLVDAGIASVSYFGTDDRRLVGLLIFTVFYLVIGLMVASPLGRLRKNGRP